MSGKGGAGGSNGRGNTGISGIPAGSRKMVQSLKEIVNCPEPEIYAMLKECNMDPNEAVARLLAQDTFHQVKSKREKKKENKETTDPRSRSSNNATHRGSRGGADRYSRGVSTQFNSYESGVSYSKPAYRKEDGTHAHSGSSSSAYSTAGNSVNRQFTVNSERPAEGYKMPAASASDRVSISSQPTSGFHSPWLGAPGQVSMADIVKMGRPHNKASSVPPHSHHPAPPAATSNHNLHLPENYPPKVSDLSEYPDFTASQHVQTNDDWPSIEQPSATSVPSALEESKESEFYDDQSNLPLDRLNQHMTPQWDEGQTADDKHSETLNADHTISASVSSRNIQDDGPMGSSLFDGNVYGDAESYQTHIHTFEHEVSAEDGASSVTANLQQLNLQDDDHEKSTEDVPSVIIPNHLQVHAQDCSHLSFGSFGTGVNSGLSGSYASRPLKNSLEESSEVVDASSAGHSDARNTEYYGDEQIRNTADETLIHRAAVSPGNYESPVMPQQEVLKEEIPEAVQGNQYSFPPSAPGYSYDNSQQLNAGFSDQQTSSQMQNINQFTNVMQAYTNSLPSTLLSSTGQPGREPDLPYSPFPVTQSTPTKYSNAASSLTGPSISMPEALRAANMSPQPTQQSIPGANMATGPALPQQLAVHPYSQPTLPLGPFANMIGYPFLPQSYTYMPSAFQQTFAGNNTYHQSLAAVLPQYKNSVSVSSLPQSAAVASAYGFGSSTSIPAAGNFSLNPPSAPGGTTIGYDDVLSSQYKDANHLISLQQNDNSAMWVHGPGSRTMSGVPASTYYSFQGQNQQPGGFRQGQQLSQHFNTLGYPNYYHTQTAMSLEHQQQNSRDPSLGGSQAQPSKQTQQLWQSGY